MWKSVLATVALAGIAPTLAADTTASEPSTSSQGLYEECTAAELHRQMLCIGYISATMDTMLILGSDDSAALSWGICPKAPITAGAALQAFKNWVQKNPKRMGLESGLGCNDGPARDLAVQIRGS